jgi:hypothetical protein
VQWDARSAVDGNDGRNSRGKGPHYGIVVVSRGAPQQDMTADHLSARKEC